MVIISYQQSHKSSASFSLLYKKTKKVEVFTAKPPAIDKPLGNIFITTIKNTKTFSSIKGRLIAIHNIKYLSKKTFVFRIEK